MVDRDGDLDKLSLHEIAGRVNEEVRSFVREYGQPLLARDELRFCEGEVGQSISSEETVGQLHTIEIEDDGYRALVEVMTFSEAFHSINPRESLSKQLARIYFRVQAGEDSVCADYIVGVNDKDEMEVLVDGELDGPDNDYDNPLIEVFLLQMALERSELWTWCPAEREARIALLSAMSELRKGTWRLQVPFTPGSN